MSRGVAKHDEGFVLVAVLWLLLLGGAIAAAIMLTSMRTARLSSDEAERAAAEFALEGAIYTVIADLVDNGGRGAWGRTPSSGTIVVGGAAVAVSVSDEAGRLDLNEGDPAILDRGLRGLGVSPDTRSVLVTNVVRRRERREYLANWADARAEVQRAGGSFACLAPSLTLYSGLSRPDPSSLSRPLARALGQSAPISDAALVEDQNVSVAGRAFRLEARTQVRENGLALFTIVRSTARIDEPLRVYVWERPEPCRPA